MSRYQNKRKVMPVFCVEKNTGYTVMSNYHLRDKRLSLKAKGLLSQILLLPEDWDYTLSGLFYINCESKDRTKRFCRRMGRFESLVPDSIPLTEEQFKTFLEKIVAAEHGCKLLNEMTAQNAARAAAEGMETAAQEKPRPAAKTAHTPQKSREDGDADLYTT